MSAGSTGEPVHHGDPDGSRNGVAWQARKLARRLIQAVPVRISPKARVIAERGFGRPGVWNGG